MAATRILVVQTETESCGLSPELQKMAAEELGEDVRKREVCLAKLRNLIQGAPMWCLHFFPDIPCANRTLLVGSSLFGHCLFRVHN